VDRPFKDHRFWPDNEREIHCAVYQLAGDPLTSFVGQAVPGQLGDFG